MTALLLALTLLGIAPSARADAEAAPPPGTAVAIFAGGCFWCMEPPFEALPGVVSATSGYTGGTLADPTYEQVSSGRTGHLEAVRVLYDPKQLDYDALLEVFWRNVDPFDGGGQFCDRGAQYRSAVFVLGADQRKRAETSKARLAERFGKAIATTIQDAGPFYAAEEYHQDYARKNPLRYRYYRGGCGRDDRLEQVWGAAPAH